jgi:threonine synthase
VLDRTVYDQHVAVTDDEAIAAAHALARGEGIFAGISSGGTLAAALKVAESAPAESVMLAVLPDTGERYISTVVLSHPSEFRKPNGISARFGDRPVIQSDKVGSKTSTSQQIRHRPALIQGMLLANL